VFTGGGFGVGLTVTDVELPLVPPPGRSVPSLGELLPVSVRSPAEKALELQRVQRLKAELAAYELELVAAFAADRPAPTDAYPPTAAQRRFLTTRDRSCRHPGCDNKAGWADADHVIPHAQGGATDCANLCCLCRRHHRLKTFAPGWTYAMTPDGILTVRAPSGVTRTSRPPGLQLTGPRVITRPPDRPPPAPDPADDPPPF
jgi:hypothetical protein